MLGPTLERLARRGNGAFILAKVNADGGAKQVVLGIFALLGDDDPVTIDYRRQLASVLF